MRPLRVAEGSDKRYHANFDQSHNRSKAACREPLHCDKQSLTDEVLEFLAQR